MSKNVPENFEISIGDRTCRVVLNSNSRALQVAVRVEGASGNVHYRRIYDAYEGRPLPSKFAAVAIHEAPRQQRAARQQQAVAQ